MGIPNQLRYELIIDVPNCQEELIKTPNSVSIQTFQNMFGESMHVQEEVHIILLNAQKKMIGSKMIGRGGMTACIVDPAVVARTAIMGLAHSFIVIHNHPSGNLSASQSDIKLCKRLKEMAKIIGIDMCDFMIITPDYDTLSFLERGLL